MAGRFEDKVVLVTGAASGIGAASARRFASEGARLADVVSPFGECVESIHAPHAGVLLRLATLPAVWAGDKVVDIGVLAA